MTINLVPVKFENEKLLEENRDEGLSDDLKKQALNDIFNIKIYIKILS